MSRDLKRVEIDSPVLRASSATMRRTIEYYKQLVPADWPASRLNDACWSEALRMAREEQS